MAVRRVQLRRGSTNDHTQGDGFTGAVGEITVDTTTKSIRVHDGAQSGGFDLMRADMSNNLAVTGNINFTDDAHVIGGDINTNANDGGDATHILDLGGANTTIRVRGTLSVANQTTENDLLIQDKVIVIADGTEGLANSTDSIGILFTRTTDGAGPGAAQNPALFYWDESTDRFRIETNNVTEANADWTGGAGADLTLANLYATASVDVNNSNITNVGQIELDEITFADAGAFITITAEDALDGKAFNLKDGGNTEYLTINTSAESTTLGVVAKTTTFLSNDIDIGSDAANDVVIEVVARTGDNDGSDLTIKAGSAADSDDNLGGNLILASGSGVEVGGTSSIQFQTKRTNVAGVSEAMRIHSDGNVGIGDNAPGTLLQLSGADAYLTLKNTTAENIAGGAETKIIFEDHGDNALGQIEVSHQGGDDDEFGQMIFSTNNDAGLQTALTIDKDQKATFAGVVSVATSLDMTTGAINNVTDIDLDKITDRANDGIEIELTDNIANALIVRQGAGGEEYINIATTNAGPILTLAQATTLSSTLKVEGGEATIQAASGADANLYLVADNSEDGGDVWRVQAPDASRTLTFSGENNAGDGYVDVLTLTGANAVGDTSATVKGTLIVEGEIQSATDLVFQVDNDANGNNKFAFQAGDDTEVASLTEAGILTVTGLSNLNGGIAVDTDKFTVDGANTGNTATKGTLTVSGNTTIGVATEGSPDFSVVNNGGNTTFSVTGATGNTEVAGTTTLSNTLNIVMDVASGIVFNSDRDAEGDKDAALILVKDSAGGTDGAFAWDDGLNTFSFSGSKLNSVLDFSVGTLATPSTTISATTGAIATAGTAPVLTLKNTTGGNADADSPTLISFQDDDGADLARIQGSHDGGNDDTKGDLIFSTNGGGGLSEALRLDSANLATFAGNITAQDITASNGTINVGGNGATIVATNATTLTITEDTIVANGNLQVNGNITGDADEAKTIFAATTTEARLITLGGGGTVVTGGKLRVGSNIIENSDGETTVTLDANQQTTLSGDLAVQGGAGGGLASTTILLGADAARDSVIKVVARTGANDGQDLTIEAGSSATDQVNQNGGDLILSSGGGDGDGTSNIIFKTKPTNSDPTTTKMTLKGSGRLGLGETAPDTLLHLSNASSPTITLQNLTASQAEDGRSSVIKFVGQNNANTEGELGNITTAHDVGNATAAGKMVFSLFNSVDNAVGSVLTLDSAKKATFAKDVEITGDLIVQGDTTTINTATLDVEDAVIRINKGVAGGANTNDIGIFFERGNDGNDGIFFWGDDESYFILGTTTAAHDAVDFAGDTTPGGLQIASLELRDNNATSLVIKEGANAYLTFNTLDADAGAGNEQVEFGKIFTAVTGSKIGNLTLANGSITDSGNAISFGTNALTTSGLASLDGGIDVNGEVFTVSNLGATVIKNTLTLNEGTGNLSDLDVQSNATSVFKVDVSELDVIVGATSTLFTNKIQATSDADDSFQMYLKDNTATGFVISNVSDDVQFLTITTTEGSELITLAQATSLSSTLEVVGNATFDAEVNIEKANVNGIFFNSDLGANPSIDATLITVDRGNTGNDVVLAWDTSDNAINLNANSQLHLQGLGGSNALTIGGALVANATITMTTAGAITATSSASSFATGTLIGNVTYSDNDISGADANDLTIKSDQDLIFNIDFDNNNAGVHKFSFQHNAGVEVAQLTDVGNLTLGVDDAADNLTIKAIANTTNAGVNLTLKAGSAPAGGADLNGGDLILETGDGDGTGTASMVFKTKVDGTDTAQERMRFHTNGYLGIGDDAPETIVHIKGGTTATTTLTLESSANADQNLDKEGATILAFKGDETLAFAQVMGAHDGTTDDDKGTLIFLTNNDTALTEALRIDSSQNSTFYGSTVAITAPDAQNAEIQIQSSLGTANGDSWKITGSDENARTLTFSGQRTDAATYHPVLTLLANDVATSTKATFAGEVTISGTGTNALDFTNANTTIGNSIGNATLTLGATASTVAIPGDLKVATTKSLTLNNGVADAAADVDAYIYVDRGADDDVAIRWDEGTDRWMHTLDGTNYYNILNANDTLFSVQTEGTGAGGKYGIEQTDSDTLIFQDAGLSEFVITNANGTISFQLEPSFSVQTDLDIGRNLDVTGNIVSTGSRVSFGDQLLEFGSNNTSNSNDLGFFSKYVNSDAATRYAGVVYQPDSTNDLGVWKLFDLHSAAIGALAEDITIADGELATLDVNEVRGGSKVGVGDNEAGTDLTISGGASTGNGAGGSIVFKVAEASQGAGATERLPTTTALTLDSTKLATFAGNVTVSGGGLTITKTAGKTVDEDAVENGGDNAIQTVNEKSFQITVTTHNEVADDAHSADFTINSSSVSSSSVIMATCSSAHNVQVYAHSITNATSFKFTFVNRTGGAIAADTDLVINFVII